ncbi:MAG: hypothetical protein KGL53_02960, partial [Elusimicrobia bacterium]|nr:hypothetical protein [Elusimicrobiota bacterium]
MLLLAAALLLARPAAAAPSDAAWALFDAGKKAEALTAMRAAVAALPGDVPLLRDYQTLMDDLGRYEELKAEARAAYEKDPSPLNTYLFSSINDDVAEADALAARALKAHPDDPLLQVYAAEAKAEDALAAG